MRTLLTTLLLAAPAASAPAAHRAPVQEPSDGATAFARELERVEQRMDDADWRAARRQLELALEAHAGRRYVLGRLGEVELVLKRCSFWEQKGALDITNLVGGEVVRSDSARGTLELAYEADDFSDFSSQASALVYGIEFSGPYRVEVRGDTDCSLAVCAGPRSLAQVSFGRVEGDAPNVKRDEVLRFVELRGQWVDERGKTRPLEQRAEFVVDEDAAGVITVSVQETQLKASFDGRAVLSLSKPRGVWGTLAFSPSRPPRGAYHVAGEALGWYQRQRDVVFQREWPAFEAGWHLEEHVPRWMLAPLAGAKHAGLPLGGRPRGVEPDELPQSLIPRWNSLADATRARDLERVAREAEALLRREPELGVAELLRAQALEGLRRRPEAVAQLEGCVERHPAYLEAVRYLARLLLVSGRFQECLDVIARGVEAGLSPPDLQDVAVTANKGLRGPAWSGKWTHSTRHYDVASDLSRDACRQVANELEETLRQVTRRLGVDLRVPPRRFQVYLFSGAGSYRDYLGDVFESRYEETQGMYSPFLKQLLVLRSDDEAEFLHTARHEGFHQVLDSVVADPPIWLNEGLAEYFAGLKGPDGRWDDGRVLERRLRALRTPTARAPELHQRLVPLRVFVHLTQEQFMAEGEASYAQAWALVHYLKHSSVENEDALEALLQELLGGASPHAAVDRAFQGRDWRELDAGLRAHIERL